MSPTSPGAEFEFFPALSRALGGFNLTAPLSQPEASSVTGQVRGQLENCSVSSILWPGSGARHSHPQLIGQALSWDPTYLQGGWGM